MSAASTDLSLSASPSEKVKPVLGLDTKEMNEHSEQKKIIDVLSRQLETEKLEKVKLQQQRDESYVRNETLFNELKKLQDSLAKMSQIEKERDLANSNHSIITNTQLTERNATLEALLSENANLRFQVSQAKFSIVPPKLQLNTTGSSGFSASLVDALILATEPAVDAKSVIDTAQASANGNHTVTTGSGTGIGVKTAASNSAGALAASTIIVENQPVIIINNMRCTEQQMTAAIDTVDKQLGELSEALSLALNEKMNSSNSSDPKANADQQQALAFGSITPPSSPLGVRGANANAAATPNGFHLEDSKTNSEHSLTLEMFIKKIHELDAELRVFRSLKTQIDTVFTELSDVGIVFPETPARYSMNSQHELIKRTKTILQAIQTLQQDKKKDSNAIHDLRINLEQLQEIIHTEREQANNKVKEISGKLISEKENALAKQRREYEKQQIIYQSRIEDLQQPITENAANTKRLEALQAAVNSLETINNENGAILEQRKQAMTLQTKQIERLKNELEEQTRTLSKVEMDRRSVEQRLARQNAMFDSQKDEHDRALKQAEEKYLARLKQIESDNEAKLKVQAAEQNRLQAVITKLETDMQDNRKRLEDEIRTNQEQIKIQNTNIDRLTTHLSSAEERADIVSKALESERVQFVSLNTQMKAADDKAGAIELTLRQELNLLRGSGGNSADPKSMDDLATAKKQADEMVNALRAELEINKQRAASRLKNLEADIQEKDASYNGYQAKMSLELRKLRQKLQTLGDEMLDLTKVNTGLNSQISKLSSPAAVLVFNRVGVLPAQAAASAAAATAAATPGSGSALSNL